MQWRLCGSGQGMQQSPARGAVRTEDHCPGAQQKNLQLPASGSSADVTPLPCQLQVAARQGLRAECTAQLAAAQVALLKPAAATA